ncbi:unnamed protein product [Enterobius vermicularis]|uniref:UDP-N-acetylglucosamine diphosphorylase n=1 Tax=Enterobius vermicularis TaxID=51028 RepID=A0A0N4VJC0_ENTVE|nr:unnamed protein product [Enterobius vermicularis]
METEDAHLALFNRQPHLLKFWDNLSQEQREFLIAQYRAIDVDDAIENFKLSAVQPELRGIDSIEESRCSAAEKLNATDLSRYWEKGLKAIAEGKVAVVVLAGGQASRLGATSPKGMLSIGIKSCDSLFELQAARIARLQHLAEREFPGRKGVIQWLVMTSDHTKEETTEHFKKIISKFGLSMDQVTIFKQGKMPCFDLEGNFILADKGKIALAPDGNGGLYAAIEPYLEKLHSLGTKYFHVYCVDNILCRVADPHFLGFCIENNADCAAKAVEKTDPNEAVGVICRVDGKVKVVEYSELDQSLAEKRLPDGLCTKECRLSFHRASKKIPYVNDSGIVVKPNYPNGVKNFFVWEVSRGKEFSPLKNADSVGKDCLKTCKRDLQAEHRRWLAKAGAIIEGDGHIFIHPLKSYIGEDLEEFKGQHLSTPLILAPEE